MDSHGLEKAALGRPQLKTQCQQHDLHEYISLGLCYRCCAGPCEKASQEAQWGQASTALQNPVVPGQLEAWHSLVQVKMCFWAILCSKEGENLLVTPSPKQRYTTASTWPAMGWARLGARNVLWMFSIPQSGISLLADSCEFPSQSTGVLLCAQSFTPCSWTYLRETITQSPLETVAHNGLFHQNPVRLPCLKAKAGTTTPYLPWT